MQLNDTAALPLRQADRQPRRAVGVRFSARRHPPRSAGL